MDKSLDKIFKTIDSIDADENIKNFYKDLLLFESKNKSPRYIEGYKKLIKVPYEGYLMHLKSVTINNFRPFYGKNLFNFDNANKSNLNVIFGKNGCGKSSFINAIYWCLFNIERINIQSAVCNYNIIEEKNVGDEIPVSVVCSFIENDEIINVEREIYFEKINDFNEIKISRPSDIKISYFNQYEVFPVSKSDFFFNFLPKDLFPFLLFDSDYFDFFIEEYSSYNLKGILYKFLSMNTLNQTISHIDKLLNDYDKKIRKLETNEYSLLLSQKEETLKKINETKKRNYECRNQIIKLEEDCLHIELKLREYSDLANEIDIVNIFDEINHLSIHVEDLNRLLERTFKEKGKLAVELYPRLVALSTIEGKFNSDELNNKLSNTDFKDTGFYEGYLNISHLFNHVKDDKYFKNNLKEIRYLENELYERYSQLENLKHTVLQIDNSDLNKLISMHNKNKEMELMLKKEIKYLEHLEKTLKNDLNSISRALNRCEEEQKILSPINQKYQFCLNAKEFGELVRKQVYDDLISDFSIIINNYFINEFKMSEKFKKIDIDDYFNISIIKKSNQKILINDLSTNERKLFIISLIFSIHEYLRFDYPIILMDPFVNLDDEKKSNLISFILNSQQFNQILLILNENQYDDNIKVNFLRNSVNEYNLINTGGNVEVISYGKEIQ